MMNYSAKAASHGPARAPRAGDRLRAAALGISLLATVVLGACAGDTARSGSSVKPDAKSDVVGGGGQIDEIYREIYSPGDPRWSDF